MDSDSEKPKTDDNAALRFHLIARARHYGVPVYLISGLVCYFVDGVKTGGFLHAVLCDKLFEAVQRGDMQSRSHLSNIVEFICSAAPEESYGSPKKVGDWLLKKADERLREEESKFAQIEADARRSDIRRRMDSGR